MTRRKLLTREMELPTKGRGCNRSICTEKKGRQLIDKEERGYKKGERGMQDEARVWVTMKEDKLTQITHCIFCICVY